jgi:hypothetical protein
MNNAIMQSLGLDQVEADPNKIPDNKYDGEIFESRYVVVASKNQVSHVLTYKVTEGTKSGAQKQEWFTIGTDPVQADGTPATTIETLAGFTPSMTEQQKTWYKKRLVDVGVAEDQIPDLDITTLVGTPVTFGVKTNDAGFQNVNFCVKREAAAAPTPQPVTLGGSSLPPPPPSGLAGDPTANL